MFKSASTSLILLGILAIVAGIVAIAWPGVTVLALVIMFAVFVFVDALLQALRAFSSDAPGPVVGHLVLAAVDILAGVVALAWPRASALVVVLVIAIWAFAGGFWEIIAAFGSDETSGSRAMLIIGGLLSVIFGVVLFTRPGLGVAALALLFGLFAVMDGVAQVIIGTQLRSNGQFLSAAS
jgi:uncharacterized membrane protein HdeD (DUF308 family)